MVEFSESLIYPVNIDVLNITRDHKLIRQFNICRKTYICTYPVLNQVQHLTSGAFQKAQLKKYFLKPPAFQVFH